MPRSVRSWSWSVAAVAAVLALTLQMGASAARAQSDADAASRAVIEQQLDAFQRDDWDEAFGYASPGIQGIFQTPQRFSEMVRGGYPMVWRPSDVEFLGSIETEDGRRVQRLRLIDQAGTPFIALYEMVLLEGVWRIAGVDIRREAVGA